MHYNNYVSNIFIYELYSLLFRFLVVFTYNLVYNQDIFYTQSQNIIKYWKKCMQHYVSVCVKYIYIYTKNMSGPFEII